MRIQLIPNILLNIFATQLIIVGIIYVKKFVIPFYIESKKFDENILSIFFYIISKNFSIYENVLLNNYYILLNNDLK